MKFKKQLNKLLKNYNLILSMTENIVQYSKQKRKPNSKVFQYFKQKWNWQNAKLSNIPNINEP